MTTEENNLSKVIHEKGRSLEVTEGITGMWHFHISENGAFTRGLCGAQTMRTNMALQQWGIVSSHIGETYCAKCAEISGITKSP